MLSGITSPTRWPLSPNGSATASLPCLLGSIDPWEAREPRDERLHKQQDGDRSTLVWRMAREIAAGRSQAAAGRRNQGYWRVALEGELPSLRPSESPPPAPAPRGECEVRRACEQVADPQVQVIPPDTQGLGDLSATVSLALLRREALGAFAGVITMDRPATVRSPAARQPASCARGPTSRNDLASTL
jgi:hypothetical protein